MAEAVARDALERAARGTDFRVASAGVAVDRIGAPADPRAIACVAARGLDLTGHTTRAADGVSLAGASRVYALDRGIMSQLQSRVSADIDQHVRLLTSLVPSLGIDDIADPYDGTATDYERAFAVIEAAVAALVADLRR